MDKILRLCFFEKKKGIFFLEDERYQQITWILIKTESELSFIGYIQKGQHPDIFIPLYFHQQGHYL